MPVGTVVMNHNTIIISIKHIFHAIVLLYHSHCYPTCCIIFAMGRGNIEYIISDAVAHESLATIHAISEIRQRLHRVAGVPLSLFKSPSFIAEVVRHYNSTSLFW